MACLLRLCGKCRWVLLEFSLGCCFRRMLQSIECWSILRVQTVINNKLLLLFCCLRHMLWRRILRQVFLYFLNLHLFAWRLLYFFFYCYLLVSWLLCFDIELGRLFSSFLCLPSALDYDRLLLYIYTLNIQLYFPLRSRLLFGCLLLLLCALQLYC